MEIVDKVQVGEKPVWGVSVNAKLGIVAAVCGCQCKIYSFKNDKLQLIQTLDTPHTKTIRRVSIKPVGEEYPTLALGSFDSTCSIFGSDGVEAEWEMLAVIEGHENEVKGVDWSFDARYLATCGRDKTIWVWETDGLNEEFECVAVLSEHDGDVKSVKWSLQSHSFLSCSYDDTLKIWRQDNYNEDNFDCVASINIGSTVWDGCWIDDSTVVVCTDDGRLLQYHTSDTTVNSTNSSIKPVELWELVQQWTVAPEEPIYGLYYDHNTHTTFCCGAGGVLTWLVNSKLQRLVVSPERMEEENCVAGGGEHVVVGSDSGELCLVKIC